MPLNPKGEKIKKAMKAEYGPKKGEEVFYASENAGKIKNVTEAGRCLESFQKNMAKRHGK